MAKTPGDANLGAAGAHLLEFSHKMQQRAAQEKRGPAKVIQLPLWPEPKRGAPNAVLRGALFAAIQGKTRQSGLQRKQLIATQDGITTRYTGAQLDQADLDVWEQALHLGPDAGPRHGVPFHRAQGFLKALGPPDRQAVTTTWLQGRPLLDWLTVATVEISNGPRDLRRLAYRVSFSRDEDTGRYCPGDQPQARASFFSPFASGRRSTGSSASSYVASPWRYGCTASMPATPSPSPAERGLPAQAQRQPDQAAPQIQAKSEPRRCGDLVSHRRDRDV